MAVPDSLILASEVIGFISFAITLLTVVGVYADLIRTLRGAPTTIPIALGNLRDEIRYEQRLCHHKVHQRDDFRVFPGKRPGQKDRKEYSKLLSETLSHLWREFCDIERRFLVKGEKAWDAEDGSDEGDRFDDGSGGRRPRRGRRTEASGDKSGRNGNGDLSVRSRPRIDPYHDNRRQSFIKSRMGWIEAGLSRDRTTYYNTDLAHRFLWWWKKDDVNSLMDQVQRIQVRRVERDSYESNELVKRALRIYGQRFGDDDVFRSSDSGGGSGSDDGDGGGGGGGGGGDRRSDRVRRSSNYRRSNRRQNERARRGGLREVSEKEIITRTASSPKYSAPPRRRAAAVNNDSNGSRRERSRRRSVVYDYELADPGRIHVEYEDPRQDQTWHERRQRARSQERRRDDD